MKKLSLLLLALFACGSIMANVATQNSIDDGLVAYYPFNGNANDESGNGNHGTVIGHVELVADKDGNPNSAYRFYGEPLNYISVPDNETLHCSTFTLSAWVYSDGEDYGNGFLINKGRDIFNGSYRLLVKSVGATTKYDGNNGAYIEDNPETKVWHFIAGTVDGDVAKFYLDGVLMDERTLSYPFQYSNSDPLTLGMHYYSGVPSYWAYPLKGVLDEVRIYNRALSESEVKSLYSGSSTEDDVPINKITLNAHSRTIQVGESVTIDAVIEPSNATNKKLEWRSSDVSVATVSNGVVTGVKEGTVFINAIATDGSGKSGGCIVRVKAADDTPVGSTVFAYRGFENYQEKVPVIGMTADGKCQVFIKWTSDKQPIGTPTIRIINSNGSLLTTAENETGSISALQTKFGEKGFVYEAPKDFISDYDGGYYFASFNVPVLEGGSEPLTSVRIYRPGLILVHGLWGNATSFESFANYLKKSKTYKTKYILVDYHKNNADSFYDNTNVNKVMQKACHNIFDAFLKDKIISAAYDLVGHSMGGILSRLYVQENNPDAAHKIITVNTPHWGSGIADNGEEVREALLSKTLENPKSAVASVPVEIIYYKNPAIYDLMSTSEATENLGKSANVLAEKSIPVHAVCSYMLLRTDRYFYDKLSEQDKAYLLVSYFYLIKDEVFPDGESVYESIFNGDFHDGVVELTSQKGGLIDNYCTIEHDAFGGIFGVSSNAHHIKTTKWIETQQNLESLLKASVTSSCFSKTGFKSNSNRSASQSKHRTNNLTQLKAATSEDSYISISNTNMRIENDSVKVDIELTHSDNVVRNIVFGDLDEDKVITGMGRDDYTLLFPNTYSGSFKLYTVGRTDENELVCDSVLLEIPAMATIEYINFIGEPSGMSVGQESVFSVKAIWSNGEETYIQPEFTISDESILKVNDYYIEALAEGSSLLTATYEGHTVSVMIDVVDYGEIDGLTEIHAEGACRIYNNAQTLYIETLDAKVRNLDITLYNATGAQLQQLHITTNGTRTSVPLDLPTRHSLYVIQCISDDFKRGYRFVF